MRKKEVVGDCRKGLFIRSWVKRAAKAANRKVRHINRIKLATVADVNSVDVSFIARFGGV